MRGRAGMGMITWMEKKKRMGVTMCSMMWPRWFTFSMWKAGDLVSHRRGRRRREGDPGKTG